MDTYAKQPEFQQTPPHPSQDIQGTHQTYQPPQPKRYPMGPITTILPEQSNVSITGGIGEIQGHQNEPMYVVCPTCHQPGWTRIKIVFKPCRALLFFLMFFVVFIFNLLFYCYDSNFRTIHRCSNCKSIVEIKQYKTPGPGEGGAVIGFGR